jgi:hypothetical protein
MKINSAVAKIAANADMRERLLRVCPTALNGYFVSRTGELMTREEADKAYAINILMDGMDFVANCVRS